jgi:hypothetical protein
MTTRLRVLKLTTLFRFFLSRLVNKTAGQECITCPADVVMPARYEENNGAYFGL